MERGEATVDPIPRESTAVGLSVRRIVEPTVAQTESALAGLRRSFDEQLSVLQSPAAGNRLRSIIRGCKSLGGKVKTDSGY